jgi:hypothetical protein
MRATPAPPERARVLNAEIRLKKRARASHGAQTVSRNHGKPESMFRLVNQDFAH